MLHEINRINMMESVVLLYSGEHITMPFFSNFARASAQSSGIRRAHKNGAMMID
jgi:hypothetical protein